MSSTAIVLGPPGIHGPFRRLQEVFRRRDLLLLLVQKELRVKYRGTLLGLFWSLLNPLLMMAVYTAIFSVIGRFSIPHYQVYLLSGLLPWSAFAATLTTATSSVVLNGNLVRRVSFPVELLPLTTVTANIVNLLPGIAVLAGFAVALGQPLGIPLVSLPLLLLLQGAFTLGIAFLLSALDVYFRDIEHLVGIGLTVWFFATPVLYPLSVFEHHQRILAVIELNPMTWLISAYQSVWHGNTWPDWTQVALFTVVAAVLLTVGVLVFQSASRRFAEEV